MPLQALGRIERSLRDAVRVLLQTLTDAHRAARVSESSAAGDDDVDEATRKERAASVAPLQLIDAPLGSATARFLGSWLAEEAESVHKELVDALPVLLRFADSTLADDEQQSALVFLLPCLQLLTSAEEGGTALLKAQTALRRREPTSRAMGCAPEPADYATGRC